MAGIQFRTVQSVILEYELGSLGQRMGSYVLDVAFSLIVAFAVNIIFSLILGESLAMMVMIFIVATSILWQEMLLNGTTMGKRIFGLKVVHVDGSEPEAFDYLLRWVFRLIDMLLSAGVVGLTSVHSSSINQRLGDLIAGTVVIVIKNKNSHDLNRYKNIEPEKLPELKYPQVKLLNDQYGLVIKNSINRAQKYNNSGNKKMLKILVNKLKTELEIEEKVTNDVVFLKEILKDYVLHTR